MRRLVLVQLILFALVAVVVVPYGIYYVVGPQGVKPRLHVYSRMTDARGLTDGTVVTYRGVAIGKVSGVHVDVAAGGARVDYSLDSGVQIPTDSIAKVSMGTAAGIQEVDVYPKTAGGPYLRSGDELPAPEDRQPAQMSDLMVDAKNTLTGIDPKSVSQMGTELGSAFDGLGPSMASLIDNGDKLSRQLTDQTPQLRSLLDRTGRLVDTMVGETDSFDRGVAALRDFTTQLDSSTPTLVYLTDQSPAALNRASQLFDRYRGTFGGVLANLVTVEPIISDRTDALATGLEAIPTGLSRLQSIVHGNRADFSLVATQGPVCSYDTKRRAVGDLTPVEPNLGLYCPPAPNLEMRGAQNAPRPDGLGLKGSTTPGSVIGPPVVPDPVLVPTGVDALNYWKKLLEGLNDGGH